MPDIDSQLSTTVIREMIRHENDVTNHRIIHGGICRPVRKHLVTRLAEKSLAAHVSIIKCHSTSAYLFRFVIGLFLLSQCTATGHSSASAQERLLPTESDLSRNPAL